MKGPPEDEFKEFVRTRSVSLVRLAFWMTGNWQDAEDIAQGALIEVYLAWPRQAYPDAYVRRIVINASRRRFRLRRREVLMADVPGTMECSDASEAVAARRTLLTALASLPHRQRAVVVLRYCLDKPEAEVAAVMGCSAGTVKSQASKALAKLRVHPALALDDVPRHSLPGGDSE